jgi:hypothetical protein
MGTAGQSAEMTMEDQQDRSTASVGQAPSSAPMVDEIERRSEIAGLHRASVLHAPDASVTGRLVALAP